MAVLIRTSDLPAASRYAAWRSVVCDTLGPLDMRSDPEAPLSGQIEAGRLGLVNVGRIQTITPHSVHRTPHLIRSGGAELYRVVLVTSGQPVLSQDGRITRLRAGSFAIYDFSRPYELAYDSAVELAVFGFPRDLLALPADTVRDLAAVPIAADQGAAALAAPLLRRVTLDLDSYQPASAARLCTVMMDLVTAAVAERAGQADSLAAESRERTLLLRVHAFIEQHMSRTDLAPGLVAAAHHVSVRYLHRLFEAQDTTVAAWIPPPATGALPQGPGRPGAARGPGQRRRRAVGPAGPGAVQPDVPARVWPAARRVPVVHASSTGWRWRARPGGRPARRLRTTAPRPRGTLTAAATERIPQMATKLFVNIGVKDLARSQAFFTGLGFQFFGMTDDMASIIISEHTQVMLLAEPTFAMYATKPVVDASGATESILVLGLERREEVDDLVDRALAAGATPAGEPQEAGGRYQRGFADLDGHHWAALCLLGDD
jgi:predicted lactoylglutathione lyase